HRARSEGRGGWPPAARPAPSEQPAVQPIRARFGAAQPASPAASWLKAVRLASLRSPRCANRAGPGRWRWRPKTGLALAVAGRARALPVARSASAQPLIEAIDPEGRSLDA